MSAVPFSYRQYPGNGSTTTFSVPFPYLLKSHVKVYIGFNILDGTYSSELVDGAGFTWSSGTQIQCTAAPASGQTLTVIRVTPNTTRLVDWQDGSNLISNDLDTADLQNLYAIQEQQDRNDAGIAQSTAAQSAATAATASAAAATSTANSALASANTAISTANGAVSTANAASSTATQSAATAASAVATANQSAADAAAAVATANQSAATAASAVSTANSAVSTANSANSTAQSANTAATNAVSVANSALSLVAGTVNFVPIANVAAIPASPANNDAVQIVDSTGIESFTPLSGLPAGFVGSAGLFVRLQYDGPNTTWDYIGYGANDPDTRYLQKSGGTLTGALTLNADPTQNLQAATKQYVDNVANSGGLPLTGGTMTGQILGDNSTSPTTPGYAFDGDPNTGLYTTGADELALATGGTARLTIDPAGAVAITNSLSVGGQAAVVTNDARLTDTRTPTDGTVTDAKVAANAAIAGTKVSPNFGSQNISTTGTITTGAITLPNTDGTSGQVLSTNGSGTLSWATAAAGGASVTTSDTAPASPSDGDLWYDSVGGRTYVYYQDPNGSQWVDAAPQGGGGTSGKILQVVENNSSTTQTSSTTTYSSLITASITPSSSSNKILIHCSVDLSITANTNAYAGIAIYRGTTSGTELVGRVSGVNSGVLTTSSFAAIWLDSPATTSSQTYTLAFRKGSGNTTSVSTDGKLYNIVLMEVAA